MSSVILEKGVHGRVTSTGFWIWKGGNGSVGSEEGGVVGRNASSPDSSGEEEDGTGAVELMEADEHAEVSDPMIVGR